MTDELTALKAQCAAQQAQLHKLTVINQALMARVEAGSSAGALAPYAAFQQAAVLAEQMRERTAELHQAYDELRRSMADSESLRQSERWIRTITDNVPAMLAYLSADCRYLFTNRHYDQFYGMTRGSLQNASLLAAHGEAGRNRLQPYINQVLAGDTVQFEIAEHNAEQQRRELLKSYVPHQDQQGHIIGFFVLCRDITERKQISETLRQANLHLEQRVQQRTAALTELNQQLEHARIVAEQANASKSQFLAAVSHDVLQPLNAARLFNGALMDLGLPDVAGQLTQSVANALDDMAELLRTLVDLSRLDAGQLEHQLTAVALTPMMERLYQEYLPQAQVKGIRLRVRLCPYPVITDPVLLMRVMRNLLSNALRYTPTGGSVLLGWRKREHVIELQVVDTGIGIDKSQYEAAFTAFTRLAPSAHRQEKGLGLGLAIVDKICGLLQHPIRLVSSLGKGSLFALSLPQTTLPILSPITEPIRPRGSGAVIWVVDNELSICQAMDHLLTGWGYVVFTATSGSAFASLSETATPPDLLIIDYHLTDCQPSDMAQSTENGVAVAMALRQQLGVQASALPILLVTADHSSTLAQQVKPWVTDILYKPIKPLKLRVMLQKLLALSGPVNHSG